MFEWHAAFREGRRALVLHAGTHRTDVLPGSLHLRLTARAFASASAAAGPASIRFGQPRQHRLRISLERLGTPRAAEVVRHPVMLDAICGGRRIDVHAADWVPDLRAGDGSGLVHVISFARRVRLHRYSSIPAFGNIAPWRYRSSTDWKVKGPNQLKKEYNDNDT